MKSFKDFISEATTIDLDKITDKKLNKLAWNALKKKQKVFFNAEEQEVKTWNDLKKEVDSVNDLYKYTDWKSVTAKGKSY